MSQMAYFLGRVWPMGIVLFDYNCDWITAVDFPAGEVPKGPLRMFLDEASGEISSRGLEPRRVSGLNGSSMLVRFDGVCRVVEVNPSRIDRREAVVGVGVEAAKRAVNALLCRDGQPEMSADARVTRLDLNGLFCYGREAPEFLRFVSQSRYRRLKPTVFEDTGVEFGFKSRSGTLRAYDKSAHLRREMMKFEREDREPLRATIEALASQGAIRLELEMRRMLDGFGLRCWSDLSDERCESVFRKEVLPMAKVERFDLSEFEGVPARLIGALTAHFYGFDLRKMYSPRQFYRIRKELASLGYDVTKAASTRLVPKAIVMEVKPFVPPEGYEYAVGHRLHVPKLEVVR
ncbi:MAG: hypothetical protein [Microviridae sp.]|nr:MAG: hypothetical protein [Microviridae sp.]